MPSVKDVISGILQFDLAILPGYTIGKGLTVATRSEAAIKLRSQLGIPIKPQNFDEAYKAALIDYGIGKPKPLLDLFKHDDINQAFRRWFDEGGIANTLDITSAVLENDPVGQRLRELELDAQAKFEVYQLALYLTEQLRLMQSLYDQIQDAEIRKIHSKVAQLASIDDLNELRKETEKQIENQQKAFSDVQNKLNKVRVVPEIIYDTTVFRDRRQSELALFLDENEVEWEYFRYYEQVSPTEAIPGPRFEIKQVLLQENYMQRSIVDIVVVTTPVSGDFNAIDVLNELYQQSFRNPLFLILKITSSEYLSETSNLPSYITKDELIDRNLGELDHDMWLVSEGNWDEYSWYKCPHCDKLSIVYNLTVWDIKDGEEEPLETCPYCYDDYINTCPRCDDALYDSRIASYCDSCQYDWDKMERE